MNGMEIGTEAIFLVEMLKMEGYERAYLGTKSKNFLLRGKLLQGLIMFYNVRSPAYIRTKDLQWFLKKGAFTWLIVSLFY